VSYQPRAWIELDASALLNNIERVDALNVNKAEIMAVVKANAYGHGLAFVCEILDSYVDEFAVAALDEALALRALLPEKPIVLLSGFYDAEQIEVFQSKRIIPLIFNLTQIGWLEASGVRNLAVGLKLDTGMGRLGLSQDDLPEAISRLQFLGFKITLISHFASADTPESAQNEIQHRAFEQSTGVHGLKRSFANSAAIVTRPLDHFDLLRPGIMLYGSSPVQGVSAASLGLKPVMRLYATLLDIKQLAKGESVGYSAIWTTQEDSTIGIVSMGYGDGYPRVMGDAAHVVIAGKPYPLIGRVSMDSLAIKLDDTAQVSIGDRVELWGETIPADQVASWAGTISYELFCKLTSRVERVYGKI
jgi:alanine racemase